MNYAAQSPGVANVNRKPILDMHYTFVQMAMLMITRRLHSFTYLTNHLSHCSNSYQASQDST